MSGQKLDRWLALEHQRSTALRREDVEPLRWALVSPFSLAVTKGIPFGFFSSAELYA